jgi:hypothetical protein
MKGSKIIIASLVLAGVGTALFFILKKSKEKSKKEFILSVFEDSKVTDAEYSNIKDGLEKMDSTELGVMYDFMLIHSEHIKGRTNKEIPQDLAIEVEKIFDKYNFPK